MQRKNQETLTRDTRFLRDARKIGDQFTVYGLDTFKETVELTVFSHDLF